MTPAAENIPAIQHRAGDGKYKPHPADVGSKKPKKLNPDPKTGDQIAEPM